MRFIKTPDTAIGTEALLERLSRELADGKNVLWLLSGGSSIPAEVQILQALRARGLTASLVIMLLDERYGPVGHKDSNWQQILEAGADFSSIKAIGVLADPLKSFEETVADYSVQFAKECEDADVVIGLIGIGQDAHIAGILPYSPAAESASELVIGYDAPPLKRMTPAHRLLLRINVGFSFVYGESKAGALNRLKDNKESFAAMPAKLLWELQEAYVYNDQLDGDA